MDVEHQLTPPLHLASEEVVVGQLPVYAGVAVEAVTVIVAHQRSHFIELEAFTVRGLVDVALLTEGETLIVHTAKDIYAACTVVDVEGSERVVVPSPAGRLRVGRIEVEAEAVTLMTDSAYADDAADGSIVLRSWVGDDFDALDILGTEAFQLGIIRHTTAIDIDQRRALAYDFQPVRAVDDAWGLGKHIVRTAHMFQHRTLNAGLQAFACYLGLWPHRLHHHLAKQLGIFFHTDSEGICSTQIERLVADARHFQQAAVCRRHNLEHALLVGDSAFDKGRIRQRQKHHVHERQRIALLVRHSPAKIRSTCAGSTHHCHHHSSRQSRQSNNTFIHIIVGY